MMRYRQNGGSNPLLYRTGRFLIAAVWLINGLGCKVLNWVPRHEQIVATILGSTYAREWTIAIGLAETGMAIWVISGLWPKLNAWVQIIIIGSMNILECWLAPGLLLWGRWNGLYAFLFILFIAVYAFFPKKPSLRCGSVL